MTGRRFLLILVACIPLCPQSLSQLLEKAPPDTEEALRATISKFYQAHVDGKFRLADELVAEDSKDVFFAAEKRRCRSFEIVKVKYSDNFTRATAVVACDTELVMPMGGRVSVKMPLTSLWKSENGRWWWYVPPPNPKGEESPFGTLNPNASGGSPPAAGIPATPVDPVSVAKLVKADKQEVRLDPAHPEGDVQITNQMPGAVSLALEYSGSSGLKAGLDRQSLNSGESATLSLRHDPSAGKPPASTIVRVIIMPTQQVIPIRIRFERPEGK